MAAPAADDRVKWLNGHFRENGSFGTAASLLGVSVGSVRRFCAQYGVRNPRSISDRKPVANTDPTYLIGDLARLLRALPERDQTAIRQAMLERRKTLAELAMTALLDEMEE
jgi:hypothetical protein